MKIDWEAMVYIVLFICVCLGVCFNMKLNNDTKMKQIEYCREMKIENCPEVK